MADKDFPRLLYKKSDHGNARDVWGLGTFEIRRVADQAETDASLAEGWTLRPDDAPPAKKVAKAETKGAVDA